MTTTSESPTMERSWKFTTSVRLLMLLLFLFPVLLTITEANSNGGHNRNKRRRTSGRPQNDGQDTKHWLYSRKERKYLREHKLKNIPATPQPFSVSPLPPSSSSYLSLSSSSPLSSSSSSSSSSSKSRSKGSRTISRDSTSKRNNPYLSKAYKKDSAKNRYLRRRKSSLLASPSSSSSSSSSSSLSSKPSSSSSSSSESPAYTQNRYDREIAMKRRYYSRDQRSFRGVGGKPSKRLSSRRNSKGHSRNGTSGKDSYRKNRYRGSSPSSSSSSSSPSRDERRRGRTSSTSSSSSSSSPSSSSSSSSSSVPRDRQWYRRKPVVRSSRPNIVVIMTDDQDVLLGSLEAMPKLRKLMTRQGVFFNNSFVPTPMCCPSRSSFLTGMYVHNHNVYTNNDNCSSVQWQKKFESRAFATYINSTYNTGYFGKYLNEYNGSHTPAGWRRWVGLYKNSRFYNYSVYNEKGERTKHEDNYYKDYLTDLVANDSITFLQDSKKRFPDKPVMMMLSVPAPHGPEDAAPQYQHMFVNNTFHRTASWNHAPNPDKQWLLQNTYKMIPQHKLFTDLLQRRRLQTLQSVDDLVEKVIQQLSLLGELSNTYIIYTSDHGYHLGQFGLLKGKAMPFDFDTRVPLIMRGPGIRPGTVVSNIVSSIDMAPTIIDMAGGSVPDHMDGQSVLKLLRAARDRKNVDSRGFVSTKKPWRDSILLEKGKLTRGVLRQRMRTEEMILFNQVANGKSGRLNFYIPPRTHRLAVECSKDENRLPCRPQQKWYCIEDNGRLRRHKCRHLKAVNKAGSMIPIQGDAPYSGNGKNCVCRPQQQRGRKVSREQRRRRRRLMKKQAGRDFQSRFSRVKRSVLTRPHTRYGSGTAGTLGGGSVQMAPGFTGFEHMFNRRCRILSNQSVLCDLDIYQKTEAWASHKERIDDMIKEYRKALEDLRDIRRHLIMQRPLDGLGEDGDGVGNDIGYGYDVDGKASSNCNCDKDEHSGGMLNFGKKRRTKPLDREERRKLRRQQRKQEKNVKRNTRNCRSESMQCFTHNNEHWKTPPYWNYGPFCFCSNAKNNTFWCLRTINQTHDFLYCEFITTFMSFFDMHTDPFQLKNTVTELNYGILQQLHEELKKLKQCAGAKDCTLRSSQKNRLPSDPNWAGLVHLRRSTKSRSRSKYKDDVEDVHDDEDDYNDDIEDDDDEDGDDFFTGDYDTRRNPPDYE